MKTLHNDGLVEEIDWIGSRDGVATTSAQVAAAVKLVGHYGDSGTALLPDSTGVVGFVGGRLYFAPFAQRGQIGSQGIDRILTTEMIAASAVSASACGRFGLKAGIDVVWGVAA
jgi:hypothetical protein